MDASAHVNRDDGMACIGFLLLREGLNVPLTLPVDIIDNPGLSRLAVSGCPFALAD
jgi:hypothetical protein